MDRITVSEILFPKPVITRYLRILPITWSHWCSLRFEVLGLRLSECPAGNITAYLIAFLTLDLQINIKVVVKS